MLEIGLTINIQAFHMKRDKSGTFVTYSARGGDLGSIKSTTAVSSTYTYYY